MVQADRNDSVDADGLAKAGFTTENPFLELGVEDRTLIVAPITTLTQESLKDSGMDNKSILKCKNMFTLGMACFIYSRPMDYICSYIEQKFAKKHPEFIEPNKKVLNDGFNYAANIQAIGCPRATPVKPSRGAMTSPARARAIISITPDRMASTEKPMP